MSKRIVVSDETGCWNWQGSLDQNGYGMIGINGKTERVHRVTYKLFVKSIPRGKKWTIDHLCRNHSCCNPEHLELVTNKVNILRGNGITAKNARKTHCKYGHPLPEYNINSTKKRARAFCRVCDSIRHKKRMQGPQREYWLKKAREAAKRYYSKNK